ncbi:MAG: ABC transporter permease [Eubacterium sp.]|nr:ABC transporter permease [Eubacterium sp.]
MAGKSGRTISATREGGLKEKLLSWEGALVILLIVVNIFGAILSPNYNLTNILRESPRYLAEIFMLFGMAFILVLGDIDISVGSIVCLTATVGCLVSNAGMPLIMVLLACLATGLVCGMINGFVATQFTELPTMIVTLGTQIIFRGIAEVALGSGGSASMINIQSIAPLRTMVGPVPLSFFFVVICIVAFIVILNKTTFGRKLYAIGSNSTTAYYTGIEVQKIRFFSFSLIGFLAGMCGLFLLASTYGANTTTGNGFEMEVIAMCVFGGIATTGGKGNIVGGIIAALIIVCLRIAFGQINMNTQLILVIIGAMLIISVLIPAITAAVKKGGKKGTA